MFKKLFISLFVLILLGAGIFVYLEGQQKAVVSETLSARSQEYLKAKQTDNDSEWKYQQLDRSAKQSTKGQRQYVGECFSFVTQYEIFNVRVDEEKCSGYFAFRENSGKLVIYTGKASVSDFEGIPGVPERRKQPELYKESTRVVNGKEYLFFRNLQEAGYETLAVTVLPDGYLTASLRASSDENTDKEFEEILGSVEIGQNNQ